MCWQKSAKRERRKKRSKCIPKWTARLHVVSESVPGKPFLSSNFFQFLFLLVAGGAYQDNVLSSHWMANILVRGRVLSTVCLFIDIDPVCNFWATASFVHVQPGWCCMSARDWTAGKFMFCVRCGWSFFGCSLEFLMIFAFCGPFWERIKSVFIPVCVY
jgi:hypothetical protein